MPLPARVRPRAGCRLGGAASGRRARPLLDVRAWPRCRGAPLGLPVVQTFHALGSVKRRHQGADDTSPPGRVGGGARRRAPRRPRHRHLHRRGLRAGPPGCPAAADDRGAVRGRHRPRSRPDGPVRRARPAPAAGRAGPPRAAQGRRRGDRGAAPVPDVELLVAGGPPARRHGALDRDPDAQRLRDIAAAAAGSRTGCGSLGAVVRADVPALLRSADAVVCVPWYEPFGIVPLEAMACGRPVVASAVGGIQDTVVDQVTGLLVPPRRPDLLAAALRDLLGFPDPRRCVRHRRPRPRAGPLRLGSRRRGDRRRVRGRAGGAGGHVRGRAGGAAGRAGRLPETAPRCSGWPDDPRGTPRAATARAREPRPGNNGPADTGRPISGGPTRPAGSTRSPRCSAPTSIGSPRPAGAAGRRARPSPGGARTSPPAAGRRTRCSPQATGAAPRRRSTSPRSWSAGSTASGARCRRSRCTPTRPASAPSATTTASPRSTRGRCAPTPARETSC